MTSETCPHCGAEGKPQDEGGFTWYACDSFVRFDSEGLRGTECFNREISNLRSHNRDLQQAYDHVLECEQNRCREVVELQERIASAPVVWITTESLEDDNVAFVFPTAYGDGFTSVRLVRDDQPGETDA